MTDLLRPIPNPAARRVWPLLALLLAGGLILLGAPPAARYPAASLVLFFLPGWTLLEAFFPGPDSAPERLLLALGLSLALTTLLSLYLVYLPGPLTMAQVLIAAGGLTLLLQGLSWRQATLSPLRWPTGRQGLILLLLLGLVLALRLPRLGYAEFHEDEVEVTALAVRAIQGEDYALFLHRKGPVQTLLPVSAWLLGGRINEAWARFPFALASVGTTLLGYMMARRLAGPVAGVVAGGLLALNGYNLVFGRMVQYQSIVLFLSLLALYALWRADWEHSPRWLALSALLTAITLLAHYDSLLYLPVILLMMLAARRQRAIVVSLLGLAAILLSFYVPYVRDPQFQHTLAYLRESRVGTDALYNNLDTLRRLDAVYSSRFYLPLLAVLCLAYAGSLARRRGLGWLWPALILGAIASTVEQKELWQIADLNLAIAPWLALGGWGWFRLRQAGRAAQSVWLWWLVPLGSYLFLVDDPRTHLYVAYSGWALIAGQGAASLWRRLAQPGQAWLRAGAALALALVCGLCLVYLQLIYFQTERAYRDLWERGSALALARLYGDLPQPRSYFGYPKHTGWKGVGALREQGLISGDFRSFGEEEFSVPIWYTFQTPRSCYTDPALYLVTRPLAELAQQAPPELIAQYGHVGDIVTEGQARIHLLQQGAAPAAPAVYDWRELAARFDARATPENFAASARPAQPLPARFGQAIDFLGFSLSRTRLAPGQTLNLDLYWLARDAVARNYRAFVHLDPDNKWGQQDDDPACRVPTGLWRAGQRLQGQFRIIVDPATPPGTYPLVLGLYEPESGQRLPISRGEGAPPTDSLTLAMIQVVADAGD
ncbi:MAG: ArnT family glycosyltransferase [Anaerolineae bacterium]